MKIQRLSTATYKFFSPNRKVVLVDPWLTNDPLWPLSERTAEKLKEIDVIAITHAHFDHSSGINEIAQQNDKVFIIAQFEYALSIQRRGIQNVIPTGFGATVDFQGIKFSMVQASHTHSQMTQEGKTEVVGTAAGYVIEFENGQKVYISGDTGLISDMKLVVSDYHKPQISILPVIGLFMMEPEQAAYAANMIGSKYVIPSHDFPKEISNAANPDIYREFLKNSPAFGYEIDTYKKVDRFMEIMKRDYPHIQTIYVPIGETVEIL